LPNQPEGVRNVRPIYLPQDSSQSAASSITLTRAPGRALDSPWRRRRTLHGTVTDPLGAVIGLSNRSNCWRLIRRAGNETDAAGDYRFLVQKSAPLPGSAVRPRFSPTTSNAVIRGGPGKARWISPWLPQNVDRTGYGNRHRKHLRPRHRLVAGPVSVLTADQYRCATEVQDSATPDPGAQITQTGR